MQEQQSTKNHVTLTLTYPMLSILRLTINWSYNIS